jgi:hypothetical protein
LQSLNELFNLPLANSLFFFRHLTHVEADYVRNRCFLYFSCAHLPCTAPIINSLPSVIFLAAR